MNRSRRVFVARALALAAASLWRPVAAAPDVRVKFSADPFSLGVASGSPRLDSVALWTRLAPQPLTGGGLDPDPIEVRWEVASDDKFARILRRGTATALAENAHSVHVEVDGLGPARWYYYRFLAGDAESPTGRTRTAATTGRGDDRLRLAFASCQQYEQGYFTAYRHLAKDAPDLVAFLGDYIYESSWGRDHVRKHGTPEPKTLADYRNRHALYRGEADLQLAHACAPWIVTWDDHEVENDYANDRSEDLDPQFLVRRAAAYRAYFEHMPLRPSVRREGGEVRLYDRFNWGTLAAIHVLDDRQYRSHQVCPKPGKGGATTVGASCTQRLDESLTLLGREQERWLDESLAKSEARWNLIAQQTLIAPAGMAGKNGIEHWTDGWDGYPAARDRLLGSIATHKPRNPVVISGDVHANYVANLRAGARPDGAIIATEFCGTSITSQGPDPKRVQARRDGNPDILLADGGQRGYGLLEITKTSVEAKLRVVESVKVRDAGISTAATFQVDEGRAGAQQK
ncbi:alkaline phosphatase D family protein [Usitatibacter palustris]|uniref:Alkaline phosphatase D n=1 Tax=Usitatibacter palustris TaxID=2732487 RepID=A0A6M4H822_9PROT|nr:alkaline phosphatase D family protein [Usitatibacter palustris]QJR15819.1 Alkaline phosphatase D [Usitatibacter palustris]